MAVFKLEKLTVSLTKLPGSWPNLIPISVAHVYYLLTDTQVCMGMN